MIGLFKAELIYRDGPWKGVEDLLTQAENLKATFAAPSDWQYCDLVKDSPKRFSLTIKRNNPGTALRAVGDSLLAFDVTPRVEWPDLMLEPAVMLVYTPDALAFTVSNGVVAQATDKWRFRAGSNAVLNMASWGATGNKSFGLLVGVSAIDGTATTTAKIDFQLGLSSRIYNVGGAGLGIGFADRPSGLTRGAAVGQALPAGVDKIEDATKFERQFSLFFTIQLKGYTVFRDLVK